MAAILSAVSDMSEQERGEIFGAHLQRQEALVERARQDLEMELVSARTLLSRLVLAAEERGMDLTSILDGPLGEILRAR